MANVCMVTGKGTRHGNNVSHSNRKTRRTFCANIHNKRFWLEDEERFVSLKVSSKGMRIIDKLGVSTVVAALRYHGIIN